MLCLLASAPFGVQAQEAEQTVVLPLERFDTGGGWLVPVRINGRKVLLMFDTGATVTTLDGRYLKLSRSGPRMPTLVGSGAEERFVLEPVLLRLPADGTGWEVQIETLDVDFTGLRRACECKVAGLLGGNVLSQFDEVRVDLWAPSLALIVKKGSRGRYLVENVAACFACHSEVDWKGAGDPLPGRKGAGGRIPDFNIPFPIYARNLTPDPETGSGNWTDEQWERALRQGIGNDGRALFPFMPYMFFREMSAEDLASVVAYLRSLRPVKHAMQRLEWPDELKQLYPPLPPLAAPPPGPDKNDPVSRGKYLVTIAPCGACHTPVDQQLHPLMNLSFAGGQPLHGPWGKVNSANITPDPSGIPHYDEAMFIKTIRTGKVNGVRDLNHIMPWKVFRNMTDRDLKDIFAYLKTLPPVQHRVDNTEPPTPCKLCNYAHGYGNRN